jgi:hypothetical protein
MSILFVQPSETNTDNLKPLELMFRSLTIAAHHLLLGGDNPS